MSNFYETVQSSANYILSHCPLRPTCGVVLGSGLGSLWAQGIGADEYAYPAACRW